MYPIEPLLDQLHALADEKYRLFNEGLTPGIVGHSIGVRMPELRKIARRILSDNPSAFLDTSLDCSVHEIRLLHAIILCRENCSEAERIARLRAFVPSIDNWAVCDLLCNDLKPDGSLLHALIPLLDEFSASENEFEVRFSLVMRMLYFRGNIYIDDTFRVYEEFRHPGYYAQMGAAWGLSFLFVDHRERTIAFLKDNQWDRFTHNKAIQKIIESHRVSETDKLVLRTLRK